MPQLLEVPANQIIILGGGIEIDDDGRGHLQQPSIERANRFISYYDQHAESFSAYDAVVVCSGGYPGLTHDGEEPPKNVREGILVADYLREAGIPNQLLEVESESTSTLTNFLNTFAEGYIDPELIDSENPLGIVTHPNHMRRAAFTAGKLGVAREAIKAISTKEQDGMFREALTDLVFRGLFLGTNDPDKLLDRGRIAEKIMSMQSAKAVNFILDFGLSKKSNVTG